MSQPTFSHVASPSALARLPQGTALYYQNGSGQYVHIPTMQAYQQLAPGTAIYTANPTQQTAPTQTQPQQPDLSTQTSNPLSGRGIVENLLAPLGLQSLADWAWGAWNSSGGSIDYVASQLPKQRAFQDRFPEYDTLAAQGRAMTPAQIVQAEQQVAQLFQQYGVAGMQGYDPKTATAKMLEGNVSIGEMDQRLQYRMAAATQYHPDVAAQLARLGGPSDLKTLTAYTTDPKNALAMIQQQVAAAQIAARGVGTGFGQLSNQQATGLAQQGVTDAQAQQGFTDLAKLNQLRQHLAGQAAAGLGDNTLLSAQFKGDAAAQQEVQAAQARQQGYFQQGGSFASSSTGISGAGSATR